MKALRLHLGGILLMLLAAQTYASSDGLAGIWQHEDEPVWIQIDDSGEQIAGVIRRNGNNAESEGFELIRGVEADQKKPGRWTGEIYAERFEEYKNATFTLPEADLLRVKVKVGFLSKTVEWNRVESLPSE